jgi:choline monooxygenase
MLRPSISILDDEQVKSVRSDLSSASLLPREAYVSQEWYDLELERVFGKTWIWVGRESQVSKVGDFFTAKIGYDPIVVVRSSENDLEAMVNVCRHRGTIVVEKKEGNAMSFACPYHAWTYGLDGALRGCPGLDWRDMEGTKGFDPHTYGLHHLKVETWNGLVFVNFDLEAEPLRAYLEEGMPEIFKRIKLDKLVFTKERTYTINANWKIFADNMAELYHAQYVHHETLFLPYDYELTRSEGNWVDFLYTKKPNAKGYLDAADYPMIPGTTKDDLIHFRAPWLFPNMLFVVTPYELAIVNVFPETVSSCTSTVDFFFPDPDHTDPSYLQMCYDINERIVYKEDKAIQESQQKGLMSKRGLARGDGRLSVKYEEGVHSIHNRLLDYMFH